MSDLPDHMQAIQRETLTRVLAAIRSDSCITHPERLGAFVNAVCNKLLRDFCCSPMLRKPLGDLPFDRQDKAMDVDSAEDVLIRDSVQQVLRAAVVKAHDNCKDKICENPEVGRDYLRVLLVRAKQQFGATLWSVQKSNRC